MSAVRPAEEETQQAFIGEPGTDQQFLAVNADAPHSSTPEEVKSVDMTQRVTVGTIAALAFPALGVLAAEPAYLLLDTAIIGHLSATDLAALAAGTTILAQVSTQLTFLSYGTTARAARFYGGGRPELAVTEGIQATWVAVGVGLVLTALVHVGALPLVTLLTSGGEIATRAAEWLVIAGYGIPMILISMAGNGWLRGMGNTRLPLWLTLAGFLPAAALIYPLVHGLVGLPELGLHGSAWSNLIGQSLTAIGFLVALGITARHHQVHWAPDLRIIRKQVSMGSNLIARSLAFQASFVSAAAVAARFGTAPLAAHQILLQLWSFISLVLDSLAIAAQALVGAALGASQVERARHIARKVMAFSLGFAALIAAGFALAATALPRVFTSDAVVLATLSTPWWILVALIPLGGLVFALDGVLLGAGDVTFLRNATLGSALLGFLPIVWLSLLYDWGLIGIWSGLAAFIVLRALCVTIRYLSPTWLTTGLERA